MGRGLDGWLPRRRAAFLAAGVPVAAICGATFGLALEGLLDERAHTSNAAEYLALTGYAGGDRFVAEPAVVDGDLITASGVAPVHFARAILERLAVYTAEVAASWFKLYGDRDPAGFYELMAVPAGGGVTRREQELLSAAAITTFKLNGQFLALAEELARPAGLTAAWWQVLGAVLGEPLTVAGIAREMGITRQSVQRVADILAERGLARYLPNPAHRRAKLLTPTEQGRDAIARIGPGHAAAAGRWPRPSASSRWPMP